VKALEFGDITIRSNVQIPLGPHPWRKPDLTDSCGGGALQGFGVYLSRVGIRCDPALGGFLSSQKKKKRIKNYFYRIEKEFR
jgi:hypothetical protein